MVGALAVGDWIGGRFQIFDVHEGGMSLVYVVNDQMNGPGPQVVALKTLRGELLRSRVRISRFATECRLWVQLGEHPNIVRAHSVEVFDGRPYVVLELIQGGDLNRWIGTPRLDLRQALRFGYQFCLGMEHALRQGLHCHRDVKPANLLVTEDGTLKITDFGLARISEEMIAVRQELPDGSIPLAEPTKLQPIIWTDPRDRVGKLAATPIDAGTTTKSADMRRTAVRAVSTDVARRKARLALTLSKTSISSPARPSLSTGIPRANAEHRRQEHERVRLTLRDFRPAPDPHRCAAGHRSLHGSRAVPRPQVR